MRIAHGDADPVGPEAGETVAAPHGIPTLTQHRVDAGTDPDEDEGRRARHRVEAQGLQSAHEMTSPTMIERTGWSR